MVRHGWYQVAFERDLAQDVSPADIGPIRLAVLRGSNGIRTVDAVCPHRGADLSVGGRLDGETLVCPFHGFRIGLGCPSEQGFRVREYSTLVAGGLVFVRLSDEEDNGFTEVMEKFCATRVIVPGFALKIRGSAEMVVENAFDQAHFRPVHGIGMNGGFRMRETRSGELSVEGTFELPRPPVKRETPALDEPHVPFLAQAYSPGIVISDLGGASPYTVITAATPTREGDCIIRLSLVLSPAEHGGVPRHDVCEHLLRRSRAGLEKDRIVWEHLSATAAPQYTALDHPIREFRAFCDRFSQRAHA